MGFEQSLSSGRAAESLIARYLRNRGLSILPVYEKIINEGKGPQLFTPQEALIAPDMLVFRGNQAFWIEAKHKNAFTWHRNTSQWTTGIDITHYEHYCKVDDNSPFPVWLFFLHRGGQAKDSPPQSPSGLYINKLSKLREEHNHTSLNWGRSGMIYWRINQLIRFATIDEMAS